MSKTITMNNVIGESLVDHGFPIHYYMRFLNYGLAGLRELNFDFPLNVKTVRLTPTSYNAIIVPDDFVDFVKVGIEVSDMVIPLTRDETLNPLNKFDSGGNKIKYEGADDLSDFDFFYINGREFLFNSQGEYLGGEYGYVAPREHTFIYIPERSEIQLSVDVTDITIVLTYITTGLSTTDANVVHPYAVNSIKTFIRWKFLEHRSRRDRSRIDIRDARREHYNEVRKLTGRISGLTIEELILAGRRAHHATMKE